MDTIVTPASLSGKVAPPDAYGGQYVAQLFKRLKHQFHLEAVTGLSQQELIVDVAAKVLADNPASLMRAAAQSIRQHAALPGAEPRRYNRAYAAHALLPMLPRVLLGMGSEVQWNRIHA